ncbi:MAG: outer membrane beta-barrel protein [Bacteroidales bacterium]|nr:MAG: outer membrane beta-barrel protein [Bacteroidales bacterium]
MKKLIFICVLFCSLCVLKAFNQTEKGNYLLGGGASASINFSNGSNTFYFALSPNMGYFIIDKLTIGASLPLSLFAREGNTTINYGITPNLRYYFGPPSDIMIFVTGAFGVKGSSTKFNDSSDSSSGIRGSAGIGGTYFLNESIGLEAILGYNFEKWAESDLNSAVVLSLGFQIYFSR